jgi:hypothetical protein
MAGFERTEWQASPSKDGTPRDLPVLHTVACCQRGLGPRQSWR